MSTLTVLTHYHLKWPLYPSSSALYHLLESSNSPVNVFYLWTLYLSINLAYTTIGPMTTLSTLWCPSIIPPISVLSLTHFHCPFLPLYQSFMAPLLYPIQSFSTFVPLSIQWGCFFFSFWSVLQTTLSYLHTPLLFSLSVSDLFIFVVYSSIAWLTSLSSFIPFIIPLSSFILICDPLVLFYRSSAPLYHPYNYSRNSSVILYTFYCPSIFFLFLSLLWPSISPSYPSTISFYLPMNKSYHLSFHKNIWQSFKKSDKALTVVFNSWSLNLHFNIKWLIYIIVYLTLHNLLIQSFSPKAPFSILLQPFITLYCPFDQPVYLSRFIYTHPSVLYTLLASLYTLLMPLYTVLLSL